MKSRLERIKRENAKFEKEVRIIAIKKQLTVYLENKPGELARVCKVLGRSEVNIVAISVVDTVDTGAVRIVVDNFTRAWKALEELKLLVHGRDVLAATLADEPGVLAEAATKLAEAGINIDYAYGSTHTDSKEAVCVFAVSDPGRAEKLLGK